MFSVMKLDIFIFELSKSFGFILFLPDPKEAQFSLNDLFVLGIIFPLQFDKIVFAVSVLSNSTNPYPRINKFIPRAIPVFRSRMILTPLTGAILIDLCT
jgi:hypothetical protein